MASGPAAIPEFGSGEHRVKRGELNPGAHGAVVAQHDPSQIRLFNSDGSAKVQGQNIYG